MPQITGIDRRQSNVPREYVEHVRMAKRHALFRCLFGKQNKPKVIVDNLLTVEKEKAMCAVGVIQEINRQISGRGRTREFLVGETDLWGVVAFKREPTIAYPAYELGLSDEAILKPTIMHEASHVYYRYLSARQAEPVWNSYKRLMKEAGEVPRPVISCSEQERTMRLVRDPLLSLFNESSYGMEQGHPFSNEGEFFASTSSILRCVLHSFWTKLDQFDATKNAIARSSAAAVVRAWGSTRLFADEVYGKLGLPIPPQAGTYV